MAITMRYAFCFCLVALAAGCVAPEEPPAPRVKSSATVTPSASTGNYEDAPLPNRKVGGPVGDSPIRLAK